jgi:wyosine [tRNA(Phe)-imidazoG37] synthetase (radical SAM superfamily)
MITFGPVPSRRLGRSLGINNITSKCCSYSCVYCQIGRTVRRRIERQEFFEPEEILREVEAHLEKLREVGEAIDYLTFVSNGEPTLDMNLGREIRALAPLGIKIGVITNASLLWREEVREDLAEADWVSLKIDAAGERVWRKLNQPHPALRLSSVTHGLLKFAQSFRGDLVTETMIVRGVNDDAGRLLELSDVLSQVNPRCCYLAITTRPPTEAWVKAPTAEVLSACYRSLAAELPAVECLTSGDDEHFAHTGSVDQDLLSITAVHPMGRTAVEEFLQKAGADWKLIEQLLEKGQIVETEFEGKQFYRKSTVQGS